MRGSSVDRLAVALVARNKESSIRHETVQPGKDFNKIDLPAIGSSLACRHRTQTDWTRIDVGRRAGRSQAGSPSPDAPSRRSLPQRFHFPIGQPAAV